MIEAATCGRWTGEDEPRSECRIAKSEFDNNCVNVDNNRGNLMLMIIKLMLTLLGSGFFGSLKARGGADLPPPSKNGGNGWEVQKLSWNLISYQD